MILDTSELTSSCDTVRGGIFVKEDILFYYICNRWLSKPNDCSGVTIMVTMSSNKKLCSILKLHHSSVHQQQAGAGRLDSEDRPGADLQCCKVKDLCNPKSVGQFDWWSLELVDWELGPWNLITLCLELILEKTFLQVTNKVKSSISDTLRIKNCNDNYRVSQKKCIFCPVLSFWPWERCF